MEKRSLRPNLEKLKHFKVSKAAGIKLERIPAEYSI